MQNYWQWLGVGIAILLYWKLINDILRGAVQQSLATWGLWGLLDAITLLSIVLQDGNWVVLSFYVLGSFVISGVLLYKWQFEWTWLETLILSLVAGCLIIWYWQGAWFTTIAGTTSMSIATVPQIKNSWDNPNRKTLIIWIGFIIVNLFYFLQGTGWEVKEVLFPIASIGLCLILIFANLRKQSVSTNEIVI